MTNRREFIIGAGAIGLGLSACSAGEKRQAATTATNSEDSGGMRLLILGGTGFIGPHMVRRALDRGHTVTLFNRGKTNAELFPQVETLIGDRDSELGALEAGSWDAVIDNSGYIPRHVRESASLLESRAKQYLFISSISAYADFSQDGIDEDYPLGRLADESDENLTGETYGPMKALAERYVQETFTDGATIVRPGYIVGPGDRTDRWTYWPLRVRQGGEMLVPGDPGDAVQFIDARDLARFVIDCVENGVLGKFNAVGPAEKLTMGAMLASMKSLTASNAEFRWTGPAMLEQRHVTFPIWASSSSGDYTGAHQVSNARALAAGMRFTSLEETTSDTLEWWDSLSEERRSSMRSGLRVVDPDEAESRPGPMPLAEQLSRERALLAELAE